MKILFVFPLLFIFNIYAYDLTVKITGIEPRGGVISLALYNNKNDWLDEHRVYISATIEAFTDRAVYTFKDIPEGYYALALLHDENRNGKMDKKFLVPLEGYGFSIPISGTSKKLIPPKFKKASLYIDRETSTDITIIYL